MHRLLGVKGKLIYDLGNRYIQCSTLLIWMYSWIRINYYSCPLETRQHLQPLSTINLATATPPHRSFLFLKLDEAAVHLRNNLRCWFRGILSGFSNKQLKVITTQTDSLAPERQWLAKMTEPPELLLCADASSSPLLSDSMMRVVRYFIGGVISD